MKNTNLEVQPKTDLKTIRPLSGFGPLAALTGAAWLRVARRRIIMARQAQAPEGRPVFRAGDGPRNGVKLW